jgi:hypothetical protein
MQVWGGHTRALGLKASVVHSSGIAVLGWSDCLSPGRWSVLSPKVCSSGTLMLEGTTESHSRGLVKQTRVQDP